VHTKIYHFLRQKNTIFRVKNLGWTKIATMGETMTKNSDFVSKSQTFTETPFHSSTENTKNIYDYTNHANKPNM
jgi:hypothetical protein